jgi:transposase
MSDKEIIRQQQFCQLKEVIRGSDQHLIIGIDVAKEKHHAFMGTATGKSLLRRLIFENNLEGFCKLLTHVEAVKVQHGLSESVFGVEPTGNYHKPLGSYLVNANHQVVLVSGQAVKNNRILLDGRWDKHDTKCAANVADLISQGKCLFYDSPPEAIVELRSLLSLRRRLKKEEHSLRMRIRNSLLAKHFPEMDRYFGQCLSENLSIVYCCLDPKKIAQMDFGRFFQLVTTRERGLAQQRRLKAIWEVAAASIGIVVDRSSQFEAQVLVEKILQVQKEIKDTQQLIETISQQFSEYHLLLTIPGFGPYVASLVLAVIGDAWRFGSAKQVLKMAGFDLGAKRSGKKSKEAVPVISKKGNAALRYGVYQAAFIASTRNIDFVEYYTNTLRGRERERGIKTKMRVKLAAKMLVIAWTLMKKKEEFNPVYLKNKL